MRRLLAAGLAASLLTATVAAPAFAQDFRRPGMGPGGHGGHGPGGPRGPGFGGRGPGGPGFRHHHGWGGGAAVGAGIAGLAAGALIGGAIANQPGYYDGYGGYGAPPPPPPPDGGYYAEPAGANAEAYCAARYKSYDPDSGTFLGYDGLRHPCP